MDMLDTLARYGLFDAKVPRYTSYPPANRFMLDLGQRHQEPWLSALPARVPVSVYVHIPFCRRLCWFCACRTQGTKTLGPIDAYLDHVVAELQAVGRHLPEGLRMGRLHLGGGTPTLLTPPQMERLLAAVHKAFAPAEDFEFSVEVDPTEASTEIIQTLADWDLTRASIGVQDFAPQVQEAIGRRQSFDQTRDVSDALRHSGVKSLNFDLLYGLPFQTRHSLDQTLDQVLDLAPDRLALYGYAHVPHVSKRQVMIDAARLPDVRDRYRLSDYAARRLKHEGYAPIGIDHFALPGDSLLTAARAGTLRRNFQGYTDDPYETLIGFGASAISRFRGGYVQNAVSTAAYTARVTAQGLAGHKGYVMTEADRMLARLIEMLMCDFALQYAQIEKEFPGTRTLVAQQISRLCAAYPEAVSADKLGMCIRDGFECTARLMAARLDADVIDQGTHSLAV